MGLKELIFNKGGIGVSMSRQETVERLNPLIAHHMAVNHAYQYAVTHLEARDVADELARLQKIARVDVGKLMESVFSAGGTAYNGVDLEPEDFALGDGDDAQLYDLLDREQAFLRALDDESSQPHQIRTTAILNVVRANSRQRIEVLKQNTLQRRRPTPAT